jgi:hypothetical protein
MEIVPFVDEYKPGPHIYSSTNNGVVGFGQI